MTWHACCQVSTDNTLTSPHIHYRPTCVLAALRLLMAVLTQHTVLNLGLTKVLESIPASNMCLANLEKMDEPGKFLVETVVKLYVGSNMLGVFQRVLQ